MQIWKIIVIAVLVVLCLIWVVVISYNKGRATGRRVAEEAAAKDADARSLFGDDIPVRPTERRLIEVMPQAVIVTDRNGRVQYASPGSVPFGLVSAGRLNSREVEDILTQAATDGGVREREVQLPIDRNPFPQLNGKGLEAGKLLPSSTLYLRVRIGDIGDDLYVIFIDDVSEQRRFEAVRRDFVTNVSHELKTPAGAIALLAETITDAADDPDAVRYFSGRITKESTRLTELVHHLIDLQKAQSSQGVMDVQRVSTLDVARAAIAENQVQADARHVDIRLSVNGKPVPTVAPEPDASSDDGVTPDASAGSSNGSEAEAGNAVPATGEGGAVTASESHAPDEPQGPVIMADREAMRTAIKNLVENAIHYSPEHTTVAVGLGQDHGTVTIRVVDQGIGIPEKSLDRVFERFYRVDPARSRATGGSGLGLAITKHCVQENGGKISVWSREGEGSTFTIEMPAAPDDDDASGRAHGAAR
ncbi:two-component system sensor histidine kinase [Bifidobacterium myosotis]|uniref:Sensor-like histidine kinase SenX3 n=1 Tax=Bifidobacterium myosotis TaxID=1630166 RepID=A0A261FQE8_9BIFI|nr:ATP-binding protein [Bifidobacterium myosotis]OZG61412.1 two-component system sensor histidine kinase [Bifidobacterium myosotis]